MLSSILRRPIRASLVLAFASTTAIGLLKFVIPYSEKRDEVLDALGAPGSVLIAKFYSEGVHTDSGGPLWGVWVVLLNFAIYVLFWYVCLLLMRYFRRSNGTESGRDSK